MIEFDVPEAAANAVINEGCALPRAVEAVETQLGGRLVVLDRQTTSVFVPVSDADTAIQVLERTNTRRAETNTIMLVRGATNITLEVDPGDRWAWLRVGRFFSPR